MHEESVSRAVEVLRSGGLVAVPTETVYGLGADAENELAVRRIFAVKGRPSSHPLIVHVHDRSKLEGWARDIPPEADVLAKAFWPGPLTMVFKRGPRARDVVTGGQDTIALRVPAHPLAQALLDKFGGGIAAPSANRFGKVSPTTAEHVRADLGGDVDFILDGGPSQIGVESTIVDLSGDAPALLRPGGIGKEELERVLGREVPLRAKSEVRVSGTLASHYAPAAGLVLCSAEDLDAKLRELQGDGRRLAVIAPGRRTLPAGVALFALPEDPTGFARELYATLREIDTQGYELIIAVLPEQTGVGLAVHDRLKRAAAPRGSSA